jgi:alpha-beta hydrolase superfamily lysophospholipase
VHRVFPAIVCLLAASGVADAKHVRYAAEGKSLVLLHDKPSPRGTVILGHGYTKKTGDWAAYGRFLHKLGFDVIVPSLPGHGLVDKDGLSDSSQVPKALESSRYDQRGEAAYRLARTRKNKVHLVGFSAGANTLLSVAENHANDVDAHGDKVIGRVIALNAFLQGSPKGAKVPVNWHLAQKAFNGIDRVTGGGASKAADKMVIDMDPHRQRTHGERQEYSFQKGTFGNIVALHRLGERVVNGRSKLMDSQVTIMVSNDDVANAPTSKKLAKNIGAELIEIHQDGHSILDNGKPARYVVLKAITDRLLDR